jgi:hypothetical protein
LSNRTAIFALSALLAVTLAVVVFAATPQKAPQPAKSKEAAMNAKDASASCAVDRRRTRNLVRCVDAKILEVSSWAWNGQRFHLGFGMCDGQRNAISFGIERHGEWWCRGRKWAF